jgi:hypothetical protein
MPITQARILADGRTVRFQIDEEAIRKNIKWTRDHPERFNQELQEMASENGFPEMVLTIGKKSGSFPEIGIMLRCNDCGGLIVFDNGLRCLSCKNPYTVLTPELLLAYIGKIPFEIGKLGADNAPLAGSTPFLTSIMRRLKAIPANRRAVYQDYFFTSNGTAFFSPVIYAYFSKNWPKSDPYMIVDRSYFDVLNIPVTHVYSSGGEWIRLCIYGSWRENVTMKEVFKNRIIPRVYTDLMFADLVAVGKLDEFTRRIGKGLYEAYNMVGKRGSETFEQVYYDLIGR